jgi:hypothetical protein
MARKVDPQRAAFWRQLIERRRKGRSSVERLCEQAGVSTASFYVWQRRLRDKPIGSQLARPSQADLVPVRIVPDSAPAAPTTGVIEIDLADAIRLRVPPGCDHDALRIVLSALRDTGGGSR